MKCPNCGEKFLNKKIGEGPAYITGKENVMVSMVKGYECQCGQVFLIPATNVIKEVKEGCPS